MHFRKANQFITGLIDSILDWLINFCKKNNLKINPVVTQPLFENETINKKIFKNYKCTDNAINYNTFVLVHKPGYFSLEKY